MAASTVTGHTVAPSGYSQVTTIELQGDGRRLAFISGQVALDDQGEVVGAGDFGAQCRFVLEQLDERLLALGGGLANVCKVTVFLRDFENYQQLVALRRELFDTASPPASSAVSVAGLVDDRLLVEIEAVAVLGPDGD